MRMAGSMSADDDDDVGATATEGVLYRALELLRSILFCVDGTELLDEGGIPCCGCCC